MAGVFDLSITEKIKESVRQNKPVGKLIPLSINVTDVNQLKDILAKIKYKKKLK